MTQPPGPQGPFPQYPGGQPHSGGFPQQPQQGGWPEQPQQGGWPEQPQAQPGGWPEQPQQGGWPAQPGAWPAQPGQPGQQGQWPQDPYGQQQEPPLQPPGQFPGYDPFAEDFGDGEKKKKSPLPWIFGGIGALVVVGGVILLIVLLGGGASKGGTPEDTAEAFASAYNDRDVDGMKALLCESDLNGEAGKGPDSGDVFANVPQNTTVEVTKVEKAGDDAAKAHYRQLVDGKKQGEETIEVPLTKNGDVWEVCIQQGGPAPGAP